MKALSLLVIVVWDERYAPAMGSYRDMILKEKRRISGAPSRGPKTK
jgi:hypothetical protein